MGKRRTFTPELKFEAVLDMVRGKSPSPRFVVNALSPNRCCTNGAMPFSSAPPPEQRRSETVVNSDGSSRYNGKKMSLIRGVAGRLLFYLPAKFSAKFYTFLRERPLHIMTYRKQQ